MKLLNRRVAIITGSSGGNGRAIANLFSENGANVVITGRDQKEVQKVTDEIRREYKTNPLGLRADVTSLSEVKAMVAKTLQKYNRIDVLVNNAGFPIKDELWDVHFDEINDEDLERVLDVDTKGTYRCSREVLQIMVKQKGGVIITISSTPALAGYTKGAPYTVAKAANLGITRHIAAEYGKYNIRCNAIAPGNIATPRNWDRLTDKEKKELVASIPLGRAGRPEEIAGVALMLASDYASFVNGQTLIVDGGETIR